MKADTSSTGGRALAAALAAAAIGLAASSSPGAGLLIADGGLGGILQIAEHTVRVTINNGIAVTEVTQVFRNTENRQVEALYTFPVPKGASVADFSMWIGGKEMVGEVVEKNRARQIYESYKPKRRDPGLLEQTDYKTFEMRIFPIGPGADQKVRIRYYQELDVDDDCATYVYPLATSPRRGAPSSVAGRFSLAVHAKSEVPIVSMESPSHGKDFVIVGHAETYFQASLETPAGDLARDFVLTYRLSRPRTGLDWLASRRPGEDGYLSLTLTAGAEVAEKAPNTDYVFVLDVSGSMADDGKLGLSGRSIAAFIEMLEPGDRFDIVTFSVVPNALFNALKPVNEETRAAATTFLAAQAAKGGTDLQPALSLAYRYGEPDRTLNVVILSDGMTDQSDRATLLDLIRRRPRNARVFSIGVGNEVNRALLEQLAEDAGGLCAFLSQGDDFQRQAKAFRRKLAHPTATDLAIQFEGDAVYDLEPAALPNLYHGAPVRLYARYRKAGPVTAVVRSTVNGRAVTQSATLALPEADDQNPELDRMWAWHKVNRLLKEADRTGSRERVIPEVIRLGEAYSIATEYTSFIVLENDAEFQRWAIERQSALRLDRDRRAQEALLKQLEAMREKAAAKLGPERAEPELSEVLGAPPGGEAAPSPGTAAPASPSPRPSRGTDFPGFGGVPVGPGGAAAVGLLVLAEWLRRRKARK